MPSSLEILSEIPGLPTPRGPFSTGIISEGRLLHISGQGPFSPRTGGFVRGSITEQTHLTLECLRRVIEHCGADISDVVSCRVYLQPLDKQTFAAMNAAYADFFGTHRPTRTTIGAQLLEIDVEIDCIVRIPQ